MLKCGIYSITNKKTGQKYIGQSKDITRRFWQHKNQGQSASRIDRAINKYGADKFNFEILEECKPSELNELETKYIKKYNTYEDENHYNLTSGGDSNYKTSIKTRNKMATPRDINYLLRKYYAKDGFTEKKTIGETWYPSHETIAKREERTFARLDLLETIINERKTISKGTFQFTGTQKERARYLIKRISFNRGRQSAEQTIVMIIVYVKLESNPNRKLRDYYPILDDYDISVNAFVRFLVSLSKFHIEMNQLNT